MTWKLSLTGSLRTFSKSCDDKNAKKVLEQKYDKE